MNYVKESSISMLSNLFSPFSLKGKTVKNRLVVPAMTTSYCDAEGNATDRYVAYYEARARGGFGIIITEAFLVTSGQNAFTCQAGLWEDGQIKSHSRLPERAHKHGALILAQIMHNGRQTSERAAGGRIYAPSAIKCPLSPDIPFELSAGMIEELVEAFSESALRAKKCGYDGVEVHGAHGYLIAQFMSPYSNKRTDRYGGNLMGRLRFPIEIIKSIRSKCGDDFIIGFRISSDEFTEGGISLEDAKAAAIALEGAGTDMIHVSAGTYASGETIIPTHFIPHGWNINSAEEIKKVVSIPVIAVGRINDPIIAESVLRSGKADFVAMGRASLTDPDLPEKAREGRLEDICHCIGCTVGCLGLLYKDVPIKCVLNPRLGREEETVIKKAEKIKTVAVTGAGPAGLYAAKTAAEAGHKVRVYEKEDRAGGQFKYASVPPTKGEISGFIAWQLTQLEKLGVKIDYNTEVTASHMKADPADVIIVSTGARPVIPDIKGADLPHVYTVPEILSGKAAAGSSVVVIGGGRTGAETAHHLALQFKKVTLVEMRKGIALDAASIPRRQLTSHLAKRNVKIMVNATVAGITETGVELSGEPAQKIPADTVVLAIGTKPDDRLAAELLAAGFSVRVIGDAGKTGTVMEALEEGFAAGISI